MIRRDFLNGLLGATSLSLIGCSSVNTGSSPTAEVPLPGAAIGGRSLGTGNVRVGMILPLSASGNAGIVAANLNNSADLALSEFAGHDLTLIIKDDGGTAAGAANAARELLQQGCEIILGPLFSESARAASGVIAPSGKPMIAFSTDPSVAKKDVYLLSFLSEPSITRTVRYAVTQGKRSFAALIPNDPSGQIAEGAYMQSVVNAGARNMLVERFGDAASLTAAARKIAAIQSTINAIFVPDPSEGTALTALKQAGIDLNKVQIIGSGIWDGNQAASSAAPNAIFAMPDNSAFRTFSSKYRARFNSDPVRIASLGYDAVSLVAGLSKAYGAARFSEANLTSRTGFTGIDGLFRFRTDGLNERGLTVVKASGGTVSPAPKSFS